MDIKIEQPKGLKAIFRVKNLPYFLAGVLLVFIAWLVLRDNSATLRINSKTIAIETVRLGEFNDYVRITGQVQPISTVQLSPLEAGVVEQIIFEEGSAVKRGDVIAVLSNNNLNLSILDSEAQLAEKQNFLRNTQITMEQERLSLNQERLQLELDVKRKRRAYEQQEELYRDKLTAKEEWLMAKEDWELAVSSRQLVLDRQKQDSIYRTVQVEQMEESLLNMRRNMELVRQRVDNLHIKSPIDGELGLLDIVLGQSITAGQKVGQVNDLSSFKIEAQINEHYIDRVNSGLSAAFERGGETFETELRKVYPEVREGQFRADFKFTGDRPENIRAGQTYYLNLQLGAPAEAVIIPRGSFYQSTGGNYIFVVDEAEGKAYKRAIKIGRQNPQYYEVVEGLEAGERVIVSSYEQYGDNEVLLLD
ncbi:MAG: efflux RND transporter periplasmic adaptor subunit [Rikenellaceae bacterium]